jgi:predicted small secreted protein
VLTKPIPSVIITIHINTERYFMKVAVITVMVMMLTACGTVGGAVSGMGKDLTSLGNTIQK